MKNQNVPRRLVVFETKRTKARTNGAMIQEELAAFFQHSLQIMLTDAPDEVVPAIVIRMSAKTR